MSDEWGPWIEHDGKGCRCVGMWAHMVGVGYCGEHHEIEGIAAEHPCWDWRFFGAYGPGGGRWARVLRYRTRRPPALREIIDRAESLPAGASKRVEPAGPLEVM